MSLLPFVYAVEEQIEIEPPEKGPESISWLISNGLKVLMGGAAIIAFFFLIIGGIQWITSGGDKTNTQAARDKITAALIGLAIVAVAYALMSLIGRFFGIDPFHLEIPEARP